MVWEKDSAVGVWITKVGSVMRNCDGTGWKFVGVWFYRYKAGHKDDLVCCVDAIPAHRLFL